MNVSYFGRKLSIILITLVFSIFCFSIFSSDAFAQQSSCEDFGSTANDCLLEAIQLQQNDGDLATVKRYYKDAIEKTDFITSITALVKLAEIHFIEDDESEGSKLLNDAREIARIGQVIVDDCPGCVVCDCNYANGKFQGKNIFQAGIGTNCYPCPFR